MLKNLKKATIAYQKEYFSECSVHGLSYITKRSYFLEKVFWVLLFGMTGWCAYYLSWLTINRYYTNPVVISIERDKFSWTTALPAVTICPSKNINTSALEEYLQAKNPTNSTNTKNFLVSLFYANYTNFNRILSNSEIDPEEYMSTIVKLQSRIEPKITVSGQILDTDEWLYQSITEMGVCYSFNSQLAVYSSPEYWSNGSWEHLPELKTLELHPLDGEQFAHIANISIAFNVYVHGPFEVADVTVRPLYVADKNFLQAHLRALSIISSQDTRRLSIGQRNCRYYHESYLGHSPVYSYVLCRMECRIMLALKLCGCVPHFYRKREQLIYLEDLDDCKCAANCEEVNYVVEETDVRMWFLGSNLQYGIRNFPEMRLKRDVIFGFPDLLAYIGGVLGLFHGASVLTIIEFVYYFTLRLFWIVMRKHRG